MSEEFKISDVIPASPAEVYAAWTSSAGHSAMTDSPAQVSDKPGEPFQAGDGYIQGRNLELEPPHRILQSWRTEDFSNEDPDSRLEVMLEAAGEDTRITLHHSQLPPDSEPYRQGWIEHYFTPMKAYFSKMNK